MKITIDGANLIPKTVPAHDLAAMIRDIAGSLSEFFKTKLTAAQYRDFFICLTSIEDNCIAFDMSGSEAEWFDTHIEDYLDAIGQGTPESLNESAYKKTLRFIDKAKRNGAEQFVFENARNGTKRRVVIDDERPIFFRKDAKPLIKQGELKLLAKVVGINESKKNTTLTVKTLDNREFKPVIPEHLVNSARMLFHEWVNIAGTGSFEGDLESLRELEIHTLQREPNGEAIAEKSREFWRGKTPKSVEKATKKQAEATMEDIDDLIREAANATEKN